MNVAIAVVWLIILGAWYFLPTIIMCLSSRDHRNSSAVVVVNLFLGWTILGWVIALVWAVMDSQYTPKVDRGQAP